MANKPHLIFSSKAKRVSFFPYLGIGVLLAVSAGAVFASAQTTDSSVAPTPSANIGAGTTMGQDAATATTTNPLQNSAIPAQNGTHEAPTFSTGTSTMPRLPALGSTPAPMVVSIENSGNALIRGVVQSVSAEKVTIATWGGVWTIRSAGEGATTVLPAGPSGTSDLSLIAVGHFVGAEGIIATDEPATITAAFVRDWTTNPYRGALLNSSGTISAPTTDSDTSTTTTPNRISVPAVVPGNSTGTSTTGSDANSSTSSPSETNGASGVLPFF